MRLDNTIIFLILFGCLPYNYVIIDCKKLPLYKAVQFVFLTGYIFRSKSMSQEIKMLTPDNNNNKGGSKMFQYQFNKPSTEMLFLVKKSKEKRKLRRIIIWITIQFFDNYYPCFNLYHVSRSQISLSWKMGETGAWSV